MATYLQIAETLIENGIFPSTEVLITYGTSETIGLRVACSPILQDSYKPKVEKMLEGLGAKVDRVNNMDYLLVTIPKTNAAPNALPLRETSARLPG